MLNDEGSDMKEDRRRKLEVLSWNEEIRAEPAESGNDEGWCKTGRMVLDDQEEVQKSRHRWQDT